MSFLLDHDLWIINDVYADLVCCNIRRFKYIRVLPADAIIFRFACFFRNILRKGEITRKIMESIADDKLRCKFLKALSQEDEYKNYYSCIRTKSCKITTTNTLTTYNVEREDRYTISGSTSSVPENLIMKRILAFTPKNSSKYDNILKQCNPISIVLSVLLLVNTRNFEGYKNIFSIYC